VQSSPELKQALDDLSATENQLRAARRLYTDEHPRVKALMDQSASLRAVQIPRLARVVTSQLQAREQELDRQLAIQGRQLQSIPPRVIAQMRLQRDYDAKAALYDRLRMSYESMKVAALSTPSEVSVLDTAVTPSVPNANRTPQIFLITVLASIGGAIGLAFLLDRADKRFRYPEQATHELGLVIVGAVPKIETKQNGGDPEEAAQVVEAFRTVRMNLQYAVDGSSSIMFTVSSPGPGDGKSLVASNLALSFAEAGHRVVLIDGDIRRGELHEMFGAARRPGLIDYLAGGVPLESILRETTHENLTLIPCGTRRHRGPELLQSSLLPALVESLQAQYEVIVVDSAPLSAGIDSFALGTALGNMLLVLRTGETDRHLAQTRLTLLQRLPIRLLGVVLNDIRPEGAYRYYSYLYGYSLEDDGERVAQLASGPAGAKE
jgi:tyrosine-protein kinase Etk/Wzc